LETYKKNRKKPKITSLPISKYSIPPRPWAKNDKEKAELCAEHLPEVFSPHNKGQDREVEQDLATPIQSQEGLKAFNLKEIKDEIKMLTPPPQKRQQILDFITARMLKELPKERPVNLMFIFNTIRLQYWPKSFKTAQIIMIPKLPKNPMDVSSYRLISLIPTISKVIEKLVLKKFSKDLKPPRWIPDHQFGFRQAHSTVQQFHSVTDFINKAMENQKHCTAVSQAFKKNEKILPSSYFNLLKSYLNEANSKQIATEKLQAASTSIPVYPKGTFLVHFSV